MLTASASEADIVEAYRLSANAFLTKPSEASRLEELVKASKDFWLTHNTVPQESAPEPPRERVVWRVAPTINYSAGPRPPQVAG